MNNLINLEQRDKEWRVSSIEFSSGIGVEHRASVALIRKNETLLKTFGDLTFEMSGKSKNKQGKQALLSEDQAYFLLTLSRNTPEVIKFKHQLVTAFSKLRRKQALIDSNHAKSEWHQYREVGKLQRRDITDTIQTFISYAKAQGSHGADFYFSNVTRTVNKALGISDRDEVGEDTLHLLATAETIAERVLLEDMAQQLPYKTIYARLKEQMETFAAMTMKAA